MFTTTKKHEPETITRYQDAPEYIEQLDRHRDLQTRRQAIEDRIAELVERYKGHDIEPQTLRALEITGTDCSEAKKQAEMGKELAGLREELKAMKEAVAIQTGRLKEAREAIGVKLAHHYLPEQMEAIERVDAAIRELFDALDAADHFRRHTEAKIGGWYPPLCHLPMPQRIRVLIKGFGDRVATAIQKKKGNQ